MKKSEIELKLFTEFIEGKMPIDLAMKAALKSVFDPYKSMITYMHGPIGYKLRELYWKHKFKKFGKNSLLDVGLIITGPE